MLLVLACGDGASTVDESSLPSLGSSSGIELTGTVAQGESRPSLLVYALVQSAEPGDATGPRSPVVGIVNLQGEFILSRVPPGNVSIVFLDDTASDGVIDEGDPTAMLADEALHGLRHGDRVNLVNVRLDFAAQHARAEHIEVSPADPSAAVTEPAPTPTPAG
jgi:hypothetical protein